MARIEALADLPKQSTIRRQLGTLATGSVEPYWVIDNCRQLLGLKCVRARLDKDPPESDHDLVEALVVYLRDAVEEVPKRQHQILLTIVLAIEPNSPHIGTTAKKRRTAAGKAFRGGRKPVGHGTIRQHHEPKAIFSLSEVIYRHECEARGVSPDAATAN